MRGKLHFEDLQFLGMRSMLRQGELLHLPVMLPQMGKPIDLGIQAVLPTRLRTPFDKRFDSTITDGVELAPHGAPVAYRLAAHAQYLDPAGLASSHFSRIPAHIGHRSGAFHLFRHNEEEHVRGESILQPGMNLFRHLSDSLDNELLAQVATASMALFIAREEGMPLPDVVREGMGGRREDPRYCQEIRGGTIMYGNPNEKPHMMEAGRPSPNFASVSEFVLRAMAASLDMPYEVLAKDFSKTNYSSARAALREAWRVYLPYRTLLNFGLTEGTSFCTSGSALVKKNK